MVGNKIHSDENFKIPTNILFELQQNNLPIILLYCNTKTNNCRYIKLTQFVYFINPFT